MKKFFAVAALFCFLTIVLVVALSVNRTGTSVPLLPTRSVESAEASGSLLDIFTPEKNTWKFLVVGDSEGLSYITEEIIADMATQDAAFLVHLGDFAGSADEETIREVKAAFETLPFPMYTIPGNNDLIYNESLEIRTPELYQSIFGDTLWSAIDHENAHFVFLDNSYRRYGFPDEELAWLTEDLATNTQPLTFLFFHRPLHLPGEQLFGDDETTFSRGQNEKFFETISPYTIDRIFNGHIHTYLNYTLPDETPVTVSGGGGAIPQDILGGEDAAYYHYLVVTVDRDDNTFEVETVRFE